MKDIDKPFPGVYRALWNEVGGLYPAAWIDDALRLLRPKGAVAAAVLIQQVSDVCAGRNRRVVEAFEARFTASEKHLWQQTFDAKIERIKLRQHLPLPPEKLDWWQKAAARQQELYCGPGCNGERRKESGQAAPLVTGAALSIVDGGRKENAA